MSVEDLAQEYILNGHRLHGNVDITMVYLRQLNSSIAREEVLAIWAGIDAQDEIPF